MGRPRPRRAYQSSNRDQWRADVLKAKSLPSSTRMFLVSVLAPHMRPDGFVSVPRGDLAAEMDVDERTITRHFTRARECGWLASLRVGHKGLTAEYMASWPTAGEGSQSGTACVPLRTIQRGTETNPLSRDKIVPLWSAKGDTWCPATSSYYVTTGTTTRHDSRACACDECWTFALVGRAATIAGRNGLGLGSISETKSNRHDRNQQRRPA